MNQNKPRRNGGVHGCLSENTSVSGLNELVEWIPWLYSSLVTLTAIGDTYSLYSS